MYNYIIKCLAVAASATLLSATSYAAPACSSFLAKPKQELAQLNPLEQIQEEISQAQTLDEANRLTYELVAFGNNVFDQAIDGIIAINTQPAKDQETSKKQARQVQGLIEALQNAFRIPSYVMGFAIANRLEIENAEAQQKVRAEQRREAIGFDRTELAKDFHADKPPKQPIGFVYNYGNKKNKGDLFRLLINQIKRKVF